METPIEMALLGTAAGGLQEGAALLIANRSAGSSISGSYLAPFLDQEIASTEIIKDIIGKNPSDSHPLCEQDYRYERLFGNAMALETLRGVRFLRSFFLMAAGAAIELAPNNIDPNIRHALLGYFTLRLAVNVINIIKTSQTIKAVDEFAKTI